VGLYYQNAAVDETTRLPGLPQKCIASSQAGCGKSRETSLADFSIQNFTHSETAKTNNGRVKQITE